MLASNTVVLFYIWCEFRRILRGRERDFYIGKVTFRRPLTLVRNHTASVLEFLSEEKDTDRIQVNILYVQQITVDQ